MSSSQNFDVEVDQRPSKRNSRPVQKFSPLRQVDQNPLYVQNKVTLDDQNPHESYCNFKYITYLGDRVSLPQI